MMAQFEYQIVEQAGGRISHLNERVMQLANEGWEPHMMTGASPHVSLLLRRQAPAQAAAPPPPIQAAVAPPVQPRPAPPADGTTA